MNAHGQSSGAAIPVLRADDILKGGKDARIVLGDQIYCLHLTKAGKLILTK
ncbi:hemin uptake protein HemP [Palleronia sp. LCG004]|uniref:hemin uptake protein HemP n=1 Tax=Palleronia sp. LCG004 TaxID=3079304 RepID=UPI002941D750|nr:hemin uptake protein HemP [Palleronia sp. LCG004]WOI56692.1 hemin uptake protein HemP [Palleronia sp. LCG004]